MIPIDYSASFVMGNLDANRIRFQIESRVVIEDEKGVREYYQCYACYKEKCFAKKGSIFYDDGYEFIPVFGEDGGVIFRNGTKQCVARESLFGGYEIHAADVKDCKMLKSLVAGVVGSTRAFYPLVAQTELNLRGTKITMEYPIKTMNTTNDIYQIDTGPVVFPDLRKKYAGDVRERFFLAHIGFNGDSNVSLLVADEIKKDKPIRGVNAMATSKAIHLDAINRIYVVSRRGLK